MTFTSIIKCIHYFHSCSFLGHATSDIFNDVCDLFHILLECFLLFDFRSTSKFYGFKYHLYVD